MNEAGDRWHVRALPIRATRSREGASAHAVKTRGASRCACMDEAKSRASRTTWRSAALRRNAAESGRKVDRYPTRGAGLPCCMYSAIARPTPSSKENAT